MRENRQGNTTNTESILAGTTSRRFEMKLTSIPDQNSNYESINRDDTGHNHGDDRFHDQLWPHDTHCRDPGAAFRGAVGCTQRWKEQNSSLISTGRHLWFEISGARTRKSEAHSPLNTMADVAPITPKNAT